MAGDWIKMRTDLADDPAVISMAYRLGIDEFAVVGRLHTFWSWLDRQSRDGHAIGVTHAWLDRHVRCEGFAASMVAVHWLVLGDDGLSVPNFERHNGETAKTRALTTNRKRKQRTGEGSNVTPESRTDRDTSVTREEKRREEKKKDQNPHVVPLPGDAPLDKVKPEERKGAPAPERKSNREKFEIVADYQPSPEDREWARVNEGMADAAIDEETSRFVRHHRAKGNRFKRPDLAWRNWIAGRFVGRKERQIEPRRAAEIRNQNEKASKKSLNYA